MAIKVVVNEVEREKVDVPVVVGDVYFSGVYHYALCKKWSDDGRFVLACFETGAAFSYDSKTALRRQIKGWTHFPKATLTVEREVD